MSGNLYGAIIEEVLLDGLRTGTWLHSSASVFKHVTMQGKIGKIMISAPMSNLETAESSLNRFYAQANAAYYANVDWALDIREAEFIEADLRGMPGHLVLRDPETQFLVTREKALQGTWRKLDLSDTHWPVSLEMFMESGMASEVLVAPKRIRDFPKLLDGLKKRRDAGVAEPD
jgi:hypothetical protein